MFPLDEISGVAQMGCELQCPRSFSAQEEDDAHVTVCAPESYNRCAGAYVCTSAYFYFQIKSVLT